MLDTLLFLIVNLAIFWVIAWAWKQDELSKRDDTDETDEVS